MMKTTSILAWFTEVHVPIWKSGNTVLPIATVPRRLLHNQNLKMGLFLLFSYGRGAGKVLWQVQDNVYLVSFH